MQMENAIQIIKPDPESHFRLRPCLCKSENVAFVQYENEGEELWRVQCFDCGHTILPGSAIRHEAQVEWNKEVALC